MASEDTTPLNSFRKGVEGIGDLALQGLDQTKLLIHKANPTVGKKVDEVEEVILTARKEFTEKGFCERFKDFNLELLRPFKEMKSMSQVLSTLKLKPDEPLKAFILWNVLCFWLGVVDLVIVGLVQQALVAWILLVSVADCFTGYCFAYYFYFVFACSKKKKWMQLAFAALVVYVLTTIYLAYAAVMTVNILEVVLNVLKASFNAVIAYHGYTLYTKAEDTKEMV